MPSREVFDDGEGLEQPVMVNGDDFAIFDAGDHYSVRRLGEGEVASIPYDASDAVWEALAAQGWKYVDLSSDDGSVNFDT